MIKTNKNKTVNKKNVNYIFWYSRVATTRQHDLFIVCTDNNKRRLKVPRAELKLEAGGETLSVEHRPILCPRRDATPHVCQRGLGQHMGLYLCVYFNSWQILTR